jgi:hypothetical protein
MKPKAKQRFNAYTKEFGNLARGCPCVCDKVVGYVVHATDVAGEDRVFNTTLFFFKEAKK